MLVQAANGQQQQAEKIDFQTSSVDMMLDFLYDLKNGQADRNKITDIFNHPDYDFEFRRYGITDKAPMVDYFMQLNTISESQAPTL